jgi:hypothetical protein
MEAMSKIAKTTKTVVANFGLAPSAKNLLYYHPRKPIPRDRPSRFGSRTTQIAMPADASLGIFT